MEDDEDVESACLTDCPWFVAPLGIEPAQYHDGSGIEESNCEGVFEAEEFIVDLWTDVEGAGECVV